MDEAFITKEVLRWARDRSGASETQVADALHVTPEQVKAWESGQSFPPFGKAQELARTLHIPFGYLFLSKAPTEMFPLPDLRTLAPSHRSEPSPEFIDLLNDVLVKQQWYHDREDENRAEPLNFVGQFKLSAGVDIVARSIREELAVEEQLQRAGTWDEYLRYLVRSAESIGILVMRSGIVGGNTQRKLSIDEFRGFAVSDRLAPLVFINGRDPIVAQIFTLAHEIAHIWIGESGISNLDPGRVPATQKNTTERFCDSVAAEVLVPASDFQRRWEGTNERQLTKLAATYRVSGMVIIRRAFELNLITQHQFSRLATEEKQRQEERAATREAASGGNFYNTLPARNSARFTGAVLEAMQRGRLPHLQAAQLLGVRTATLQTLLQQRTGGAR